MTQQRIGLGRSLFIILCLALALMGSGCGPQTEEAEVTPPTSRGVSEAQARAGEPEVMPVPPDEPGIYLVQRDGTLLTMPETSEHDLESAFWGEVVDDNSPPEQIVRAFMVYYGPPVAEEPLRILIKGRSLEGLGCVHIPLLAAMHLGQFTAAQMVGELHEVLRTAVQSPGPTYSMGDFTGIAFATLAPECWLFTFQSPLPTGLFTLMSEDASWISLVLIPRSGMTMEETLDWAESEFAPEWLANDTAQQTRQTGSIEVRGPTACAGYDFDTQSAGPVTNFRDSGFELILYFDNDDCSEGVIFGYDDDEETLVFQRREVRAIPLNALNAGEAFSVRANDGRLIGVRVLEVNTSDHQRLPRGDTAGISFEWWILEESPFVGQETQQQVRADLRSIAVGLEAYNVDFNQYPVSVPPGDPRHAGGDDPLMVQMPGFALGAMGFTRYLDEMTTDAYSATGAAPPAYSRFGRGEDTHPSFGEWILISPGPDRDWDLPPDLSEVLNPQVMTYDVTNGIDSSGDLLRSQLGAW